MAAPSPSGPTATGAGQSKADRIAAVECREVAEVELVVASASSASATGRRRSLGQDRRIVAPDSSSSFGCTCAIRATSEPCRRRRTDMTARVHVVCSTSGPVAAGRPTESRRRESSRSNARWASPATRQATRSRRATPLRRRPAGCAHVDGVQIVCYRPWLTRRSRANRGSAR